MIVSRWDLQGGRWERLSPAEPFPQEDPAKNKLTFEEIDGCPKSMYLEKKRQNNKFFIYAGQAVGTDPHLCAIYHVWLFPHWFLVPEATFKGHASSSEKSTPSQCRVNFSLRLLITVNNKRLLKRRLLCASNAVQCYIFALMDNRCLSCLLSAFFF